MKEDCGIYALPYGCTGADAVRRYGDRFRRQGTFS